MEVEASTVSITLDRANLAAALGQSSSQNTGPLRIDIAVSLKRSGHAMRLILPDDSHVQPRINESLIRAIATAHAWWGELIANSTWGTLDLARAHNVSTSWPTRILRLAFLDPAIVESIAEGTAPASLTFESLASPDEVPTLWSAQRARHTITGASPRI